MTILAILLVLTILGGSIWLMARSLEEQQGKRANRKLVRQFNRLGERHGISFSSQELVNGAIIGLDGVRRKLLVMKRRPTGTSVSKLIDLDEMRACSVIRYYKPYQQAGKKGTSPEELLEKIVLQFELDEGKTEEVVFYHHQSNHVLEAVALSNKARHWETMLSKLRFPARSIA